MKPIAQEHRMGRRAVYIRAGRDEVLKARHLHVHGRRRAPGTCGSFLGQQRTRDSENPQFTCIDSHLITTSERSVSFPAFLCH